MKFRIGLGKYDEIEVEAEDKWEAIDKAVGEFFDYGDPEINFIDIIEED